MEKRITTKIESHQLSFKNSIKNWVDENISENKQIDAEMLLQYVFDYQNIILEKEDFEKRKRTKNVVPQFERCNAKRANGEQCTRRKKEEEGFCGTHTKGTPHGVIDEEVANVNQHKKVEVWVQEIKGINYYIDVDKNVYMPEDIINRLQPPRRIGNWEQNEEGEYSIPQLNEYTE